MAKAKDVIIFIDLEEQKRQQQMRDEAIQPSTQEIRNTVFTAGSDPRVSFSTPAVPPEISTVEILRNSIDNPYLKINWRIKKESIQSNDIIGFYVYRRRSNLADTQSYLGGRGMISTTISAGDFDRLSRNITQKGDFSEERKALYLVRSSLIPQQILNNNLYIEQRNDEARITNTVEGQTSTGRVNLSLNDEPSVDHSGQVELTYGLRGFQRLAYVDYSNFIAQEVKKKVYSSHREWSYLSYKDEQVRYGELFDYCVVALMRDFRITAHSNVAIVYVRDLSALPPPESLIIQQTSEYDIKLRVCFESKYNIRNVLFYRKGDNETQYREIAQALNINDCVILEDGSIRYGQTYEYRVFLENMHGILSPPGYIKYTPTPQNLTPLSRFNTFQTPIVTAIPDQNSDSVKVIISPNDPSIDYYSLERKDLTTFEKGFSIPSRETTNYGGNVGWENNRFFVDKSGISTKSSVGGSFVGKEIVFVDNVTAVDHVYQYRVRGYDLAGNGSSYAMAITKAVEKKSVRAPINLRSEIIRGYPLRIKVSWSDDNQATEYGRQELFDGKSTTDKERNKILFKIQRRKINESTYQSFPISANNFLIDEVPTKDFVPFSAEKAVDTFRPQEDLSRDSMPASEEIQRPFNIPAFLQDNTEYCYRVAAVADNGEESNFTPEFRVSTLPALSNPINFRVFIDNVKIRPLVARLSWDTEGDKFTPDHFVIERKFDVESDTFSIIGKEYLRKEFYDHSVEIGNTYIYRIKAVDTTGRESNYFKAGLVIE